MRIAPTLATLLILIVPRAFAAEPCQSIHGRAIYYSADGQLRLWHIGTHHEFEADAYAGATPNPWDKIIALLKAGDTSPAAGSNNALYGDFIVCPTRPYREGAVQPATIRSMSHLRVVPRDRNAKSQ
jgi:hypothetical protein